MSSSPWPVLALSAAVAIATLTDAATAGADPKLRVIDHGAEVEILVTDVRMVAAPELKVARERIEVVLFGRPAEVMDTFTDRSVQRVDVRGIEPRGDAPRVLSVKLRGDHAKAVALLPGARAIQGDDGVHIWIQRTVPAAAAVAVAAAAKDAAPTAAVVVTPAGAATGTTVTVAGPSLGRAGGTPSSVHAQGPDGDAGLSPNPNPNPNPGRAGGTPSAEHAQGPEGEADPTPTPNPNPTPITGLPAHRASSSGSRLTGGSGGPGLGRVVIAIAVIGLAGLAAVMLRRRRAAAPATGPQLEVLATRDLGGKTRIVWLGAGDRELVVSVAGQQVRLLGQWRRGEADRPAPLHLERPHDHAEPMFAVGSSAMPRVRGLATPAVSGIMRLRGKVTPITDDVATGDSEADEQWARDILAATAGRR